MIQENYKDDSEKYNSKYGEYNYYKSYIRDIKGKYMDFGNVQRDSPSGRYFNDHRRNNNYYYRNRQDNLHNSAYRNSYRNSYKNSYKNFHKDLYHNGYHDSHNHVYNSGFKLLKGKRIRSSNRSSNSSRKGKLLKKFKNYDVDDNMMRVYKNGKKRSYSSMRQISDHEQRHHKVYLESKYHHEDYQNNYAEGYNSTRKRKYYSYKKKLYNSDKRRNYDTHFGHGNIFYNNEYYLFNDGSMLKKKKMYYGNKNSFRTNSKSYNGHPDRMNNKRKGSYRNGKCKATAGHQKETGSFGGGPSASSATSAATEVGACSYKDKDEKSNKSFKLKHTDTTRDDGTGKSYVRGESMGNRRNQAACIDKEKGSQQSLRKYTRGERKRKKAPNSYSGTRSGRRSRRRSKRRSAQRRRRRRDSTSSNEETGSSALSRRGSSYSSHENKKKHHADRYSSESYKYTPSDESTDDVSSRKKYNHKRNRTKISDMEDNNNRKKKKKKKENCDSDDEIVHFSWKKGMLLNNCYVVIRKMGEGTFGRVLLCQHMDTKKYYAVKVVRNIKKYTKSAKIEADILKKIQNDDFNNNNIVKYHGRFMYYDHMCLVFEPLGPSLYEIITKNNYNGFHLEDIKLYCIEMLKALNYLHKISLTHTDLKPENILLDDPYFEKTLVSVRRPTDGKRVQIYRTKSTGIKLIDFGCATFKDGYHGSIINTRQYRAPEVILNLGWDVSSDMWSFGCVLAEMYTGDLLFRTHEHLEHLAMMEAIVQPIPKKMICDAVRTNGAKYINRDGLRLAWPENASSFESIKYVKRCLPLYRLIRNELFFDFLYSILQIDPALRPTPAELLKHRFLQESYEYY
ncbi:CMGC/CLK protein kinase [Plasmodium fragile]|uniref:CMGC/CLK protein kinase n=1 Tax=Plasmodium fragile TaxID=5857 RepID=A0A0D9QJP7_PLAFR|nr:CMGC/CLK protein kinase [Plasmodium fragile]KJP85956.1 CMGC/CLK protein kinase [Plasmodium fragile]